MAIKELFSHLVHTSYTVLLDNRAVTMPEIQTERFKRFQALAEHAWLGKIFKRLNAVELRIAEDFIRDQGHLGIDAYEKAIHRMFLDKPKPKHSNEIMELLICSAK